MARGGVTVADYWEDKIGRVKAAVPSGDWVSTATDPRASLDVVNAALRGIDALREADHFDAMERAIGILAGDPVRCAAVAERPCGAFETGIALQWGARQLAGDPAPEPRLADLPRPRKWTLHARGKAALARGDAAGAEDAFQTILDRFGSDYRALINLGVVRMCAAREAAARAAWAEAARHVDPAWRDRRREEIEAWTRALDAAMADGREDGGALGGIGAVANCCDTDIVDREWSKHRHACVPENRGRTLSAHTNARMFAEVEDLLAGAGDIGRVVNYGTLCGVLEDAMAARHPGIEWIGYDVSIRATERNRDAFTRPNLRFEHDLGRALAGGRGETLLTHCRTADVMLPGAVRALYRAAFEAGVRHVLAAEYYCLCVPGMAFPDFVNQPVDTVHWDGILMVHNYPKLLAESGYCIVRSAFLPVPLLASGDGEGFGDDQMIRLVLGERA